MGGHDGRKVCVGWDCCVSPHDHDEYMAPCGCAVYDLHCGMMRSLYWVRSEGDRISEAEKSLVELDRETGTSAYVSGSQSPDELCFQIKGMIFGWGERQRRKCLQLLLLGKLLSLFHSFNPLDAESLFSL